MTDPQAMTDPQLRDAITWARGCGARPPDLDRLELLRAEAQRRYRQAHPSGRRHVNRAGYGTGDPDYDPRPKGSWRLTATLLEPGDPGSQRGR